ncbi:MAG: DUF4149 domain-containing protein [Gammaproteobacteria bacterium]|nr:DUF4149 domain-containing protein [Gammaproteobacteria bacterium]
MKANLLSERLLLTLWVGSLCAIGYIAVPMAFATLGDMTLAGDYAGKLFSAVNMLGLGCGFVLFISKLISIGKPVLGLWRFWVLVLMLSLTLTFSLYLQPEIAAIKQLTSAGDSAVLDRFDFFHTLSKNLYMFVTLLGLALVVSSDKVEA